MKTNAFALATILAMLPVSFAHAQQPQPSPKEQALSGKLMEEINSNIDYRTAVIGMIAEIKDLKKQLSEAEAKSAAADKKSQADLAEQRKQLAEAERKAAADLKQAQGEIADLKKHLTEPPPPKP